MKITRKIKSGYMYGDDDINTYLSTIIFVTLGGYAFLAGKNASYLLANTDSSNNFLGCDGKNYITCLTPAIDSSNRSLEADHFINKYGPVLLDDSGQIVCGKLDAVDASDVDVFDEFEVELSKLGTLKTSDANLRILFPLNAFEKIHWVTGEILLQKRGINYGIACYAHDPLGAGIMPSAVFYKLAKSIIHRIGILHKGSVELPVLKIESFYSPYKQRQHDSTSCGVIVATDIIKLISGKLLDNQDLLPLPYTPDAPELRAHCIRQIIDYLPIHDPSRIQFLERNCSIITREVLSRPSTPVAPVSILKKTQEAKKEENKEPNSELSPQHSAATTGFAEKIIAEKATASSKSTGCVIC